MVMEGVETADKSTLESKSITDLRVRLGLLTKIIHDAQKEGDERWKKLVSQQRTINEVLVKKIKEARQRAGELEPESVRVGMKSARMKGRAITGAK